MQDNEYQDSKDPGLPRRSATLHSSQRRNTPLAVIASEAKQSRTNRKISDKKTIAKKHFGQHFLTDTNILHSLIDAGKVSSTDTVLEIGPGTGSLTESLLNTGAKVIAVEKDRDLIADLTERFAAAISSKQLHLIEADIRDTDLSSFGLKAGEYKLIANIPYYITGLIIRSFLEQAIYPSDMVLLIQKEVAERIMAQDGKESLLSLSVKAFGMPQIIRIVKKGSFNPPPKVDSAILAISNINKDFFESHHIDPQHFFKVLHAGFAHKRKTISHNLSLQFSKEAVTQALSEAQIDPSARAEDITLEIWKILVTGIK